jgi:hypothetical protein
MEEIWIFSHRDGLWTFEDAGPVPCFGCDAEGYDGVCRGWPSHHVIDGGSTVEGKRRQSEGSTLPLRRYHRIFGGLLY